MRRRERKRREKIVSLSRSIFLSSGIRKMERGAYHNILVLRYNNAEVTRRSPKDIEREKITRTDDSRWNAGGWEKQPHNSASCTRATWPVE